MRIMLVKLELEQQNRLLLRIAEALERLSPVLSPITPPRKAELSDLLQVDSTLTSAVRDIEEQIANDWQVVPGSEAYYKKREMFEAEIRLAEGQEAVERLPWNKLGKTVSRR